MEKKVAVITGVCGQDGSYLADLLLENDYKVYGIKRRTSRDDLGAAAHLKDKIEFVEADLQDLPSLSKVVKLARPHEFYNLAAQSHVGTSFDQPVYTFMVTGQGVINCLEAIRMSGFHTRFFQASTSELFGGLSSEPSDESTPFHPRSPYGVAKLAGYWATVNYREAYRMFTCQAICFNHESPRRGPQFVTRKITKAVAAIRNGSQKHLTLGNIDAKRDWGHAKDYVRAMWMMTAIDHKPNDYVVATGRTHSVRDFLKIAFEYAGLGDYQQYVKIDPSLFRPAEVDTLLGNPKKIRNQLMWKPTISFEELVMEMVDSDVGVKLREPRTSIWDQYQYGHAHVVGGGTLRLGPPLTAPVIPAIPRNDGHNTPVELDTMNFTGQTFPQVPLSQSKHTCGKDGDPGATAPLNGVCVACNHHPV